MFPLDSEAPYVTWTRSDNSSLPSDAFVRSGTLYIDNVQPTATGEYRCLGTDRYTGRVVFSVVAHLEVICKLTDRRCVHNMYFLLSIQELLPSFCFVLLVK